MNMPQLTIELLSSLNRSLETVNASRPKYADDRRAGCPYEKAALAIVSAITSLAEGFTRKTD